MLPVPFIAELLNPWIIFGFLGQFIFFMRFVVQWLKSEKKHAVVVPMSFWWLSIIGSIIILIYSIHIKDVVFSTAQVLSLFIYARNMMLQESFAKEALHAATSPSVK
jgi:lipid-A-disaccharide synthase-like uncharacterized protein